MARRQSQTETPDADARDKARQALADLSVQQGVLLDEQYAAKIAAENARIAAMDTTPIGVTVKGNQGR